MSKQQSLENLLDYMKQSRGFDFTSYKTPSLTRRIRKRMEAVGIDGYGDYIDYLEVHPYEFSELFNTVLINVTGFFRDPDAWAALQSDVIPTIAQRKDTIRIWSAGCASGQETYTIAIILAEALGEERFREQVKIYASDADEEALIHARQAVYSSRDLEDVPEPLRAKYFEPVTHGFCFRGDLRRSLIFGRHDLLQDAPISKLDLLVCRNTLIYFNSEAQARIMARFHFALNDSGFLFLGKAELLLSHARLFTPVNVRAHIFSKNGRGNLRERLLVLAQTGNEEATGLVGQQLHLREEAFECNPVAQIVLDADGRIAATNAQARALFPLMARDLGRPIQDLELSYRPIELRSRIDQAYASRKPVVVSDVEFRAGQDNTWLDVLILPLFNNNGADLIGCAIAFTDVSTRHRLQNELQQSAQNLETAYEELQATNEELETTNEELQSTIEELETTNEELQSTNEELETMNEELQSTNEELGTINEELRRRTEELNAVNSYMDSIMGSFRAGVAVLDPHQTVRVWNTRAEDLWGMRADEVIGRSFFTLDIGLPVDRLKKPIREVIDNDKANANVTLDAINRRGRRMDCLVTLTKLQGGDGSGGVILLMEERAPATAE